MIADDERVDDEATDSTAGTESSPDADGPVSVGSGSVVVDGRRIAYRRAGTDGPPVVLLHGAGVDDAALSWEHVLPELGRTHQVYALDWPGYGDSDDVPDHSIETYQSILASFLDAIDVQPVDIAGISMGGGVALSFALDTPDRVRRLALVSSYGLGRSVPAGSLWYALANVPGANQAGYQTMGSSTAAARMGLSQIVHDVRALDESFVEAFRDRASRRGAGSAFADFQRNEIGPSGQIRTNLAPRLTDVSMPTLFVHGRQDPLFPVSWARRGAERVPDGTLVELADCGHWPTHEQPTIVTRELVDFFTN